MELTFNIIYTPGTVKYLSLFVLSWLKWSTCSFRLVANGCLLEDIRLLKALCDRTPRLELLILPSKTMIPHGEILTYLQSLECSDYFCFMDSDILVTGEFLSEFIPGLNQWTGIFSGASMWCKDEEQLFPETSQSIRGRYNTTHTGVCLGSSYFALYNNTVLTRLIQSTGLGFQRCLWQDIPPQYQARISDMGLRVRVYDTAKILNLLLLSQGEPLLFQRSSFLHHIGGVSTYVSTHNIGVPVETLSSYTLQELKTRLPKKQAQKLILKLKKLQAPTLLRRELTDAEWIALVPPPKSWKFVTSRYVTQMLKALFEGQPLPAIPELNEPEIEERIKRVTSNIVSLYNEFKEQFIF